MTLRYTRSVLQDIHDIATYLTERNPKAASHLISEFAKATGDSLNRQIWERKLREADADWL